ncbi:MAG: hypothetical protein KF832_20010 [Caldilineaceae bacterium]|nr:hypothetical protein [Caldilineaceae bacterium]
MLRLVLLRVLESYFRHRWLYLLPIVFMAVTAVGYTASQPATYVVSGTLYIQDKNLLSSLTNIRSDGFTYITPAQATMGELYQLLNAKAFLRAIIQKTDMEAKMALDSTTVEATIQEVREAISVEELGNNLVKIVAKHEMPRTAQQVADATVETYIQWKINLNREESLAAQNFFVDLAKTYRAEVEPAQQALDIYLRNHPRPLQGERPDEETAAIRQLQAALDAAEERLQRTENQEESARLALIQAESTVRQSYFVVDEPTRPLKPEQGKKDMLLTIGIFLVAGVFLSGVAIIGGALLDNTFRFPVDVEHGMATPVLTMVLENPVEEINIQRALDTTHTPRRPSTAALDSPTGAPARPAMPTPARQPAVYTLAGAPLAEASEPYLMHQPDEPAQRAPRHTQGLPVTGEPHRRKSIFG